MVAAWCSCVSVDYQWVAGKLSLFFILTLSFLPLVNEGVQVGRVDETLRVQAASLIFLIQNSTCSPLQIKLVSLFGQPEIESVALMVGQSFKSLLFLRC